MIVEIKEFSGKTGKGKAVDPAGREIEFSYKKLMNETKIPVGKKAEVKGTYFHPAKRVKTFLFYILKLIEWSKKHANIFR